jgi:excisionase family DNA binding protein
MNLISVRQASLASGISQRTILRRIRDGDIPAQRAGVGRTVAWLIDADVFDEWLAAS